MAKEIHRNFLTNQPYRLENHRILCEARIKHGYKSTEWITFLQAKECSGSVKKGERGFSLSSVIFDKDDPKKIVGFRKFTVFNSEQCENLDDDLKLTSEEALIYRTLRLDGTVLTRKQLAKASSLLAGKD